MASEEVTDLDGVSVGPVDEIDIEVEEGFEGQPLLHEDNADWKPPRGFLWIQVGMGKQLANRPIGKALTFDFCHSHLCQCLSVRLRRDHHSLHICIDQFGVQRGEYCIVANHFLFNHKHRFSANLRAHV